MSSTTVYGPQGCGKTTNAQAIAKHLGYSVIIDDYTGEPLDADILLLTATPTPGALDYFEVMRDIEASKQADNVFTIVPDDARMLDVAREAQANHLYLITNGKRSVIAPFVPEGWEKHRVAA